MRKITCDDTPLSDLTILALDCQATGASPARGHLLEIGWIRTRASRTKNSIEPVARSHLISLPADAVIPPAVRRITGITANAQNEAITSESAWQLLLAAVGGHSSERPAAACPVVIHFARFETPFIRELHRRYGPSGQFPFKIVCTHEIAARLLPELPRRGIRAIAGYYGHRMAEYKRSAEHVVATAFIWQHMVQLLEAERGIRELDQLIDWLAATKPAGRPKRTFPMSPRLRQRLPDKPGIYRMSQKGGGLLYIGKAKSLKHRVNSYFRPKAPHAEHILEMLTQARGLEVILTGTALEAAIVESDEIKRHSPPYNIALRRRKRQIAFCSKDLARHAATSDAEYPLGPLTAGKTVAALAAFGWWLRNGLRPIADRDHGQGCAILALPPEYAPDIECLRAGFELFREHYQEQLGNQTPLRFLTALGARLWRQRLAAQDLEEADIEAQRDLDQTDQQSEESDDKQTWIAETVAAAIEARIRQNAYLIRRARWFCLMSESALVWSPAGNSQRHNNCVVFENGAVIEQDVLKKNAAARPPPGYAKSVQARRNNIDLATYDRLRVATTEMRRIVSEGRSIELCLGPAVTLGRQELSRVLRWV